MGGRGHTSHESSITEREKSLESSESILYNDKTHFGQAESSQKSRTGSMLSNRDGEQRLKTKTDDHGVISDIRTSGGIE